MSIIRPARHCAGLSFNTSACGQLQGRSGAYARPQAGFGSVPGCPSFSILCLQTARAREFTMPSLFRFLTLIGVLGGLTYGAMFMLASWFDPKPREITVTIPPDRFARQP
jgi:hypothetical protein